MHSPVLRVFSRSPPAPEKKQKAQEVHSMKAQNAIAVAAALLVGVLLGYFVPQLTATAPEPEAKAGKATEKRRDRNKQHADHDADLNRGGHEAYHAQGNRRTCARADEIP